VNRSLPAGRCAAALALLAALCASPAALASAPRTFVSAGPLASDANASANCAPLAPCRTFAAALGVTAAGGEVVVLDSGGYGGFSIAQSVSIIAPDGVYAGIGVASGTGIAIAGAGISVTLKGLTINGLGGTTGIGMTEGASLTLIGVRVANFPAAGSHAIFVSSPVDVKIVDTVVHDSYYGVYLQDGPTAIIEHAKVLGTYTAPGAGGAFGTVYAAFTVDNTSAATATRAALSDCLANGGDYQGYVALSTAGSAGLVVDGSTAVGNYYGVYAGPGSGSSSGTATAAVSNSIFLRNHFALTAAGSATRVSSSANTITASSGLNFNNLGTGSTVLTTLGNNGADSVANAGAISLVPTK